MEVLELPTHIDDPAQFMIWSADEVFPLGLALVMGVLINQVFVMLVVGQAFVYMYRRYKNMRPDGYLNHLLYSFGLYPERGITLPNPFKERWIP